MNAKNLIILLVLIIIAILFLLYKCIDKLPQPTEPTVRTETSVDCGAGESLTEAVNNSLGNETIFVSGVCRQTSTVVVSKNNITIVGGTVDAQGRSFPAVQIKRGVRNTLLRNMTLKNSKKNGLHVESGSLATVVSNIVTEGNTSGGILVGKDIPSPDIKDYYPTKQKPAKEKQPLSYCYPSCGSDGGDSRVADTAHTIKFSLLREAYAATCTDRDPTGTLEISKMTGHVGSKVIICGTANLDGLLIRESNQVSTESGTVFNSNNSSGGVGISVADGSILKFISSTVTATGNFYNAFVAPGSKLICSGSNVNIPPNRLPPEWDPPEVNNC